MIRTIQVGIGRGGLMRSIQEQSSRVGLTVIWSGEAGYRVGPREWWAATYGKALSLALRAECERRAVLAGPRRPLP